MLNKKILKEKSILNKYYIIFPFIFLIAIFLQQITFPSIEEYPAHVDEPSVVEKAINIYEGELNPNFFRYPAGHMNILAFVFKIYSIFTDKIEIKKAYKISWLISNVFVACITVMVYMVCALLCNHALGLFGCLLAILSSILLQHSQYAIVDVPLSFFCTLFLTISIHWIINSNISPKKVLFLSCLTGIATSMKYTGALLILPLFVIIYDFIRKNPIYKGTKHFQLAFTSITSLILFLITFIVSDNRDYFLKELVALTTDGIIEIEYHNLFNRAIYFLFFVSLILIVLTYLIRFNKINGLGKLISPFHFQSVFFVFLGFLMLSPFTILEIKSSFADFIYEYRHMQIGSAAQYHHLSENYQSIIKNMNKIYPLRFYKELMISNFGISGVSMAIIGAYKLLIQRKMIGIIVLSFCLLMILTITSWQNVAIRYTLSFLPIIYILIPLGMHTLSSFLDKRYLKYNYSLTILGCITGFDALIKWISLFG